MSRPIHIDRGFIWGLVDQVIESISDVDWENVEDDKEILTYFQAYLTDVTNRHRRFFIYVHGKYEDHEDIIPGTGYLGYDGKVPIVVVYLNTKHAPIEEQDLLPYRDYIYSVLVHEITHASEYHRVTTVTDGIEDSDDSFRNYINTPEEVRAYLRNIIEELTDFEDEFHGNNYQELSSFMRRSSTWVDVARSMNDGNLRKIEIDTWYYFMNADDVV